MSATTVRANQAAQLRKAADLLRRTEQENESHAAQIAALGAELSVRAQKIEALEKRLADIADRDMRRKTRAEQAVWAVGELAKE